VPADALPGLADRWPLAGHDDVRDQLLAAYGTGRGYHDLRHLAEVLDRLDDLGSDDTLVLLAAWFHDAVYDGAAGDEERSAQWAERALPSHLGPAVARLVRVTARHDPADDDTAGQLLCDADLAILAAPAGRYEEYAADVRREYAHVADADFAAGRGAILRELLDRPALFRTPRAREQWEEAARANMGAELERLGR
jgi:predicted metal-dependent HD superfamily phosphohydrolase